MGATDIAIVAVDEASTRRAIQISRVTNLPFIAPGESCDRPLQLRFSAARVWLWQHGDRGDTGIVADWSGRDVRRRLQAGKNQPLARALALRRPPYPSILDATAGLGRDGVIAAALGANVTLCERNPLVHSMLLDAHRRAFAQDDDTQLFPQALIHADAAAFMHDNPQGFDVVYLDPMYGPRSKKALPKKPLQALRALVGSDEDADKLLPAASICARRRVAVKRHPNAPPLAHSPPDLSFSGERARYDVYLLNAR